MTKMDLLRPPPALAETVRRELAGENVLWASQPRPGHYWKGVIFGLIFGSIFLSVGILWFWKGGDPRNLWGFRLFGLVFVFVGGLVFLPSLAMLFGWGGTFYAVTERRAVIFEKTGWTRIHSIDAAGCIGFERVSHGGSDGNLILKRTVSAGAKGSTRVHEVGFMGLASYTEAEQAVREMIRLNSSPTSV